MSEKVDNYLDVFKNYVSNYDLENEKIFHKYEHSIRVMRLAEKYARVLNFNEEDIEIALLIGLLHDFGRFEQLRVYDSFDDSKTIDHADYSVSKLFLKKNILKFTNQENWYPIIEFAIKYHNKLELPELNDERIIKHARLIRDVDKLDILYTLAGKVEADESQIHHQVLVAIKNHGLIDRKYTITKNDKIANQYGFAFNIYNNVILREYKDVLMIYHQKLKGKEKFKEIYEEVIKYLDERIEEDERNRN